MRLSDKKKYFKAKRKTLFYFKVFTYRGEKRRKDGWLKAIRNRIKTKEWWKIVSAKLRGHFEYYGVSGNYAAIKDFYQLALRLIFKWINRRSQKKSMNWKQFINYLKYYPLPLPKIKHNIYIFNSV